MLPRPMAGGQRYVQGASPKPLRRSDGRFLTSGHQPGFCVRNFPSPFLRRVVVAGLALLLLLPAFVLLPLGCLLRLFGYRPETDPDK